MAAAATAQTWPEPLELTEASRTEALVVIMEVTMEDIMGVIMVAMEEADGEEEVILEVVAEEAVEAADCPVKECACLRAIRKEW
ncbi:hypothetical protein LTS18_004200 [Coniosporium uncinatum]|uniref:Uncharacterized protein n=1 Tax=Coniosporium uncinatum TaxID=93489 RepID=A0ACC3D608_9PEZI|nr:hypothetical protein LTS18_004200 [Coniosporium uncinatum]